ncbi:ribosome maturation factor RimP [Streptomyces sp. 3MP-14]|uniref:Ribosome maturation factor RimP n=1 Tax=Streptomyces mimosae TaxID=2586635 RepID=A0A5N6A0Q4_9ACTN|nr:MULTISPECIES: ribosome maturation factor RimP [Streptomyces]KAB8161633.1 ribosome maturation factor RimP [Streptomyces mimosae]KAB8173430.1 ribosome maturation factor RimP [Streptomyces sp. 3MP-14]
MSTQIDRLRELVQPLAAEHAMDLEEVKITTAGRRRVLQVVVDTDDGVGLDACAELSRQVSEALDARDVMGGAPYVLEVTSPGAERPLTEHRHYRRSIGRLLWLRPHQGADVVARLVGVDEEGIDVEVPGEKGRKPTPRRFAFAEIARARVELEFNRGAGRAAAPSGDESLKEA